MLPVSSGNGDMVSFVSGTGRAVKYQDKNRRSLSYVQNDKGVVLRGHGMWKASYNNKRFNQWVSSLRSAEQFINEKGVWFITQSISKRCRFVLMRHLGRVDPEGQKRLQLLMQKIEHNRRAERVRRVNEVVRQTVERDKIAVAQQTWESLGVQKFRFVQEDGILNIIASLLASCYTKAEIADILKIDAEIINRVTPEMVAAMKKKIPEAIIQAANAKVMQAMMTGDIDKTTMAAHKIATDRMKLVISAESVRQRRERQLLPSEIEEKEKGYADKFGVNTEGNNDKKTGE